MSLKNIIRELDNSIELSAAIDCYLDELSEKPNLREPGWHPSEFCDECNRKLQIVTLLRRKTADNAVTARVRRIFDVGSTVHSTYQRRYLGPMGVLWGKWICSRCDYIHWGFMPKQRHNCYLVEENSLCHKLCGIGKKADGNKLQVFSNPEISSRGGCIHCGLWGSWVYREIPFKLQIPDLEYPIVGHCDGMIFLNNVWYLLEIKTINSFGFNMLSSARQNHLVQAQVYSELLIRRAVKGLPENTVSPIPEKILIFYVGKNTSEEKEFLVPIDRKVGSEALNIPSKIMSAIKENRLLEKHQDCIKGKSCVRFKRCSVSEYCSSDLVTCVRLQNLGEAL